MKRSEKLSYDYNRIIADILIPSGLVLKRLYDRGYNMHGEGHHTSLRIGRYALALTWMRALFGVKVTDNCFRALKSFVRCEEIEAACATVDEPV